MAGYYIESFGCRANQADGDAIAEEIRHRGLAPVSDPSQADVVIVNTCTVTAAADRTARAFIRRIHRRNPGARILVTGCYAQRDPGEVAGLAGVSAVIGNSHKNMVPAIAATALKPTQTATAIPGTTGLSSNSAEAKAGNAEIYADDTFAHSSLAEFSPWTFAGEGHNGTMEDSLGKPAQRRLRTRPNLKVQDGCGNRCSFCIIPTTRGQSRSMEFKQCLQAVEGFVSLGGQELVFSGINLGRWGRDLIPQRTLEDLVEAVLSQTRLPRLRLSSIEPMDWTPRLLSLYAEYTGGAFPRLARHAHLPLQSGADATLRAMHRRYRPWHYAARLAAIHRQMPDAAIGADVMVGFPGESRALFEESFAFIREQPFTYLHLFPFSPRPETSAWEMERANPTPPAEVHERMAELREWIDKSNLRFRRRFLNAELSAITLETSAGLAEQGWTRALTDNFLEIHLKDRLPANCAVRAKITRVVDGYLQGFATASQ